MTNKKSLYDLIISIIVLILYIGDIFFLTKNNKKSLYFIIIGVIVLICIVGILFLANYPSLTPVMVDCSEQEDSHCFLNRMNQCLPVTTKMTGIDGTPIEITVLGIENETCHFQRKINNVMDLDCYFPKGTLNMDTLDQMFGNNHGLQKVVDDACVHPGW